jgi:hypothetical protein
MHLCFRTNLDADTQATALGLSFHLCLHISEVKENLAVKDYKLDERQIRFGILLAFLECVRVKFLSIFKAGKKTGKAKIFPLNLTWREPKRSETLRHITSPYVLMETEVYHLHYVF